MIPTWWYLPLHLHFTEDNHAFALRYTTNSAVNPCMHWQEQMDSNEYLTEQNQILGDRVTELEGLLKQANDSHAQTREAADQKEGELNATITQLQVCLTVQASVCYEWSSCGQSNRMGIRIGEHRLGWLVYVRAEWLHKCMPCTTSRKWCEGIRNAKNWRATWRSCPARCVASAGAMLVCVCVLVLMPAWVLYNIIIFSTQIQCTGFEAGETTQADGEGAGGCG